MKANRRARAEAPIHAFGKDERGASEIVGYMIAFGIGSAILVISLTGFNAMRDYSGDMVADRTIKELGTRVSFAVDEALQSGSHYPESDFSRSIRLPTEVHGNTFTIELGKRNIWVNLTDPGPAIQDENGNDLDTQGRFNTTLIPRANVHVLCDRGAQTDTTQWEEGTCVADSGDGEVQVKYGRPYPQGYTGCDPDCQGVYLVRP